MTDEAATKSVDVLDRQVPQADLPPGSCSPGAQEGCAFGVLGGGSISHKGYLLNLKVRLRLRFCRS